MAKDDMFDVWDRGEHFFNDVERALIDLKDGKKLGDLLKEATKCPVYDSSCESMIFIEVYGVHPEKGHKKEVIQICPIGIKGNGEKCPLNK